MAQMPPPADSVIKGIYDDVAKYETQFKGNPSAASAKRILRLLGIAEGRLASSQNQTDPSFQAATDALGNLKAQLTAAAEGRPAPSAQQAAPAQQQQQQQPASTASGNPVVQQAAADLARISGLVDTMQPGDKASGSKYMAEMKAIGDTLRGVATKDEAWAAVARDYNALQKRIVDIANQPAPAGSQPAPQPAAGDKPDPNIERALRDLKFVERNVDNLRGDNVRQEQQILAELKRIGDVIGGAPDRTHPTWKEALEYRAALYLALAKKRLAAIDQGLDGIDKAVKNAPSVEFLDPDVMSKVTNGVAGYAKQLDVYGFYKDKPQMFQDTPGLLDVFGKPDRILALMDERAAAAKAEAGELGDVVAEVDAIEARMKANEGPPSLNGQKITRALAEQYVAQVQAVREIVAKDSAYLQRIKGRTDQIDRQRLDRLTHWVGTDTPRKIDGSVAESQAMMNVLADGAKRLLDFHAADDPNDPDHQSNRFLGENRYDETIASFDEQIDTLRGAMVFEAAFGPNRKAEREAQIVALEQALAKYKADHRIAVGAVRLAKGVDDDELRDIAEEVLTSGRYEGIYEIVRIETGEKTHREETRGSISGTTTGANITASKYSWDEFQARTIEKTPDGYFIFVNNIKYFYSGGTTTPLDRWLLSGRFKSNPILEENIDK